MAATPGRASKARNPVVDFWIALIFVNLGIIALVLLVMYIGHTTVTTSNGESHRILSDEVLYYVKWIGAIILMIIDTVAANNKPTRNKM